MKQTITITVDIPEEILNVILETLGIMCTLNEGTLEVGTHKEVLDKKETCKYIAEISELTEKCQILEKKIEKAKEDLREANNAINLKTAINLSLANERDTAIDSYLFWKTRSDDAHAKLSERDRVISALRDALAAKDKVILKKNSLIADLIGTMKTEGFRLKQIAEKANPKY